MYKGNTIVGKPIVTYDLGEQIGKVADLVIDFSNNQILGLSLSEGQWSQHARMLPLHEVHTLGPDVIIVSSRNAIVEVEQTAKTKPVLGHDMVRKRIKLLTTDGRDLGAMTDVYFDERSGAVQGYEVEGGFFAAASCGRSFVPASHALKIGVDVVFVPPETVEVMTEQAGEVTVTSDTSQAASGPQAGAREFAEAESLDVPVYRTIEETKGRRVRRSVQTPTGFVVAAQGQIVSDAVIEQARAHHQEQAVLEAVKLSPDAAIHSKKVGDLWWRTSERLREETAQVVEGAGKVWGRVKDTVTDLTKRSTGQPGEQRASNGHPSSPSSPPSQSEGHVPGSYESEHVHAQSDKESRT